MRKAQHMQIGLLVFGGTLMVGCSLASPTYITSEQAADDPAETSESSSTSSTSPASTTPGGADTCASDDFAKPDLAKLTACGGGKGHCFDAAKTPLADQLTTCPTAGQVCVPDEILLAGGAKLKSCNSIIGPGGCVTASLIPEIEKQGGSALKQDACNAGQLCVPCTDPTHNNAPTPFCTPIGVHDKDCSSSSSAPPAPPPAPPAPCCTTNGKSNGVCIAETAIPEAQRSQTKADVCTGGNKCVPAAFVAGTPVTCTGGLLGTGVCMDKCFDEMMSFASNIGVLSTQGCGTTEVCVPCSLVSGKGVPGCPK